MTDPDDSHTARAERVLAEYMQRVDAGEAVDREQFLAQHADVAAELRKYFEGCQALDQFAAEGTSGKTNRCVLATTGSLATGAGVPGSLKDLLRPCQDPAYLGHFDRYEIIEELGRGGMGIVLKAHDPRLKRVVAIKILSPALARDASARERFIREAQAAAAVSHDHVVTIHAVDEAAELPFLVMEYVAGTTLQQRIDQTGPLQLREILRIGMQTASGLAAAHAQGLVHRDIKPANILLENHIERVKIADFGLVRLLREADMTRTGEIPGTPRYMAPEQAQGQRVDFRADLFSLGAVSYAMCTGVPPFEGDSALAVMRNVCDRDPVKISKVNLKIPQYLIQIIDRLLAKQPLRRFDSARQVEQLLAGHLARLQEPVELPRSRPNTGTDEGTRFRRTNNRWQIGLAACLALLLGAGLTLGMIWPEVRTALRSRQRPNQEAGAASDADNPKATTESPNDAGNDPSDGGQEDAGNENTKTVDLDTVANGSDVPKTNPGDSGNTITAAFRGTAPAVKADTVWVADYLPTRSSIPASLILTFATSDGLSQEGELYEPLDFQSLHGHPFTVTSVGDQLFLKVKSPGTKWDGAGFTATLTGDVISTESIPSKAGTVEFKLAEPRDDFVSIGSVWKGWSGRSVEQASPMLVAIGQREKREVSATVYFPLSADHEVGVAGNGLVLGHELLLQHRRSARYRGASDGKVIRGTFVNQGHYGAFELALDEHQEGLFLQGSLWKGSEARSGGTQQTLTFDVRQREGRNVTGVVAHLPANQEGIAFQGIVLAGSILLSSPDGVRYFGSIEEQEITGTAYQQGHHWPFRLARVDR